MEIKLGVPEMDLTSKGDTWDACWADDGNLYLSSDDSYGFNDQPKRNLHVHVLRGDTPQRLRGETINLMDEYGGMSERGPDGCMWKANGLTSVDGVLYLFVSRHEADAFVNPLKKDDSKLQTAGNSSVIMSTDKGRTWRRTARENYERPMFPGRRFGSPFFVKYGQDSRGGVHGGDRYVYAVANNGFWENGDDMILARVLRERLALLNATDWQFYGGGNGLDNDSWTTKVDRSAPILINPGRCGMTGVQYIEPLERYLMVQWYYTGGSGHLASEETEWIFYVAQTPWGPWHDCGHQRFPVVGYYNPCIAGKFISSDGKKFEIFTNGNFKTHNRDGFDCLYRLTRIPCTVVI